VHLITEQLERRLLHERAPPAERALAVLLPPLRPTSQLRHVEKPGRDRQLRDVEPMVEWAREHREPRAGMFVQRPEAAIEARHVPAHRPCARLKQTLRFTVP